MIYWFFTNPDGTIWQAGRSPTLPTGATQSPSQISPAELVKYYLDGGGALTLRPPSPGIVSNGTEHTIADCPPGTVINIEDNISGEQLGSITTDQDPQTEVINLPDPGTYIITVTGPSPMLPTEKQVVT
ncbi:hypothetical protein KX928_12550 [Roseobacter sp. YSTF-M11]|uniref:Uncharacterized protein n=1 Tax=Roseobacter insulae TaxID=2859783 RepID=A0A9X1K0W2_9RHOB|nr:hypothetical protein [Roseobacter insulae]MBW4708614.1 hypothetical protein [Roseobacter insulae]